MFLSDPRSSLLRSLPQAAIRSANAEVRWCVTLSATPVHRNQPRDYNSYTPRQKAAIGKYAIDTGVMAARRKFSALLKLDINESSLRHFKNVYLEEKRRKDECDDNDSEIEMLLPHRRCKWAVRGGAMAPLLFGQLPRPLCWHSHPIDRARGQVRREPCYLSLV